MQSSKTEHSSVYKMQKPLKLTGDSWSVMEQLTPLLHLLKCATTVLCGESPESPPQYLLGYSNQSITSTKLMRVFLNFLD